MFGRCMPVRWNEMMAWKYGDDRCGCGQVETGGGACVI